MNFLQSFLDEHHEEEKTSSSTEIKKSVVPKPSFDDVPSGILLIGGCINWSDMTSKGIEGLNEYHQIKFEFKVIKTFSSAFSMHFFILLENNDLYSMGQNKSGQLGIGELNSAINLPKKVILPIGKKIKKVATGRNHSLILFENGELYGCGSNECGQGGRGDGKKNIVDISEFAKIETLHDVKDISCGHSFSIFCDDHGECDV